MTFFVPFDGGRLSELALRRAVEFAAASESDVIAFSVIPRGNVSYARERWLDADESYDTETILNRLRDQIAIVAPEATFKHTFVGKHEVSGRVATAIRKAARDVEAQVVFIGSKNAGHIVSSVANVGPTVAADETYDVYIARRGDNT